MNNIVEKQNSEKQLRSLAAQRRIYGTAKQIFFWHFLLSVPLSITCSFLGQAFPDLKGLIAVWGLLVVLADTWWLTPWRRQLCIRAATIQEAFDCEVLGLPWNNLKAGAPPDPELVIEMAAKYQKTSHNMPPLINWYPQGVAVLPLHIARIICQRSNCWWDLEQRKHYTTFVMSVLLAIFLIALFFGFQGGASLEKFVIEGLIPLSPAFLFGIRQVNEHRSAANRLSDLKRHTHQLWNDAFNGKSPKALTAASRELQNEILENRRNAPPVFDAVFKLFRANNEQLMNSGAEDFLQEAQQKLSEGN